MGFIGGNTMTDTLLYLSSAAIAETGLGAGELIDAVERSSPLRRRARHDPAQKPSSRSRPGIRFMRCRARWSAKAWPG
jgi:hypothetical protein